MKAISLWNPWAALMVRGAKCVETRSWPIAYRGPLLIHAAKKWDKFLIGLCETEPFRAALAAFGDGWEMPFGAIVGRVDVIGCYPTERVGCVANQPTPMTMPGGKMYVGETERAFRDYSPGRFAWLCANPVAFEKPVPYRGAQMLFEVPDELLKGVR